MVQIVKEEQVSLQQVSSSLLMLLLAQELEALHFVVVLPFELNVGQPLGVLETLHGIH